MSFSDMLICIHQLLVGLHINYFLGTGQKIFARTLIGHVTGYSFVVSLKWLGIPFEMVKCPTLYAYACNTPIYAFTVRRTTTILV